MSVYPSGVEVRRTAKLSPCGLYRYALARDWTEADLLGDAHQVDTVTFIMLNPSTADHEQDDPTIRRCVGFTRALGATRLVVVNLYAYRATKPADLWRAADPVGPENDVTLAHHAIAAADGSGVLIAAWGSNAKADRVAHVFQLPAMALAVQALALTADGQPRHPLYLPADARPFPWVPA